MVLVRVEQGEGKDDGEQGGELGAGGRPNTPVPDLHAAMPLCPGAAATPSPLCRAAAHGWAPTRRDRASGVTGRTGPSIAHIPSHLPPLHLPKLDIAMKKD